MAFPWTCSICALRCDDVKLASDAREIAVGPGCSLAASRLGRVASQSPRSAAVQGKPVSWAEALDAATAVVRTANRLSIAGTTPDFQTARAAIDLAVASGAILDFQSTPTLQALGAAVGRDGLTTATLGDVRQHADRVVWIGRPAARLPRLRERFTADLPTLTVLPKGYGGGPDEPQVGDPPADSSAQTLRLETDLVDWLRDVLLELQNAAAASGAAATPSTASTSIAVERLLSFVRGARYLAIMVADDAFSTDDDLQAGSWLLRLVERFGQTCRCVLLMPDASAAARQTLLWRTGFAGPVQFANRVPSLSVARPRCDAAVRLQPSLSAGSAAEQAVAADASRDLPMVLLGDYSTPDVWVDSAEVFLPVGWAGVDHAGTTVRGDGTVTLALQSLPEAVLEHRNPHRAADVLAELLNAIAQRERA